MKLVRIFIKEYLGRQVGDILDIVDTPQAVLSDFLKEVEVTDNFNIFEQKAIVAEDGSISFEEDESKIALKRNLKLEQVRSLRNNKLLRVDQLINIAVLDAWTTAEKAELKVYRQALLDITESYKVDMSLLDDVVVAELALPIEPTAE